MPVSYPQRVPMEVKTIEMNAKKMKEAAMTHTRITQDGNNVGEV